MQIKKRIQFYRVILILKNKIKKKKHRFWKKDF